MKDLSFKEINLVELNENNLTNIEGGIIGAWPMWLKVSLTIGGCGAAGYAVGRLA